MESVRLGMALVTLPTAEPETVEGPTGTGRVRGPTAASSGRAR